MLHGQIIQGQFLNYFMEEVKGWTITLETNQLSSKRVSINERLL